MNTKIISKDIKDFLERESTKSFLVASRHFVALFENDQTKNIVYFEQVHAALVDLYSAGYKLDEIDLIYSDNEKDYDREVIFDRNKVWDCSELGEDAFYWEVFDPRYSVINNKPIKGWTKKDKEPTQGYLVDDFLDIYRDLKIELEKIDKIETDGAIEDALWQMKWSFINHWGHHCVNAIRALHYKWL
jgi:hypothetical protein